MLKIPRCAHVALVGLAVAVSGATGCNLSKQETPSLTGPSEFGTSVVLAATPEVLPQDGASQSFVTATVRDTAGQPMKDVVIRWSAVTSDTNSVPASVALNATTSVTDANGRAMVVVTAPQAPAQAPVTPNTVTVQAAPLSLDSSASFVRFVTIRLQPPANLPPATTALVPRFTVKLSDPHAGVEVSFDASTSTTRERTVITTYAWNFGDGVSEVTSTPTTSHVYTEARTYPVTLTITNNVLIDPAVPDKYEHADVARALTVLP